jgi:hypothetical protein
LERVQKMAHELHEALNYTPPGGFTHLYQNLVPHADATCILPSPEQRQEVLDAVLGVAKIEKWATVECGELRRAVGRWSRSKPGRHYFVCKLADLYATAFDQRPTSTQSGPWVTFLMEMLAICERKRLTLSRARARWLNAKGSEPKAGRQGRRQSGSFSPRK